MKTIKKFNVPNYPTRQEVQEFVGLSVLSFFGITVLLYALLG